MGDCSQFTLAAPLFSLHERFNSTFHIGGDRLCFLRVPIMTWQQIRGLIPPLASQLMSVSSTEHAGSLTRTKCSILLAPVTNRAILLNVSCNRPKHPWKENKTSVLCESSEDTCAHVCRGHLRLRGRALACWRLQSDVYKKWWLVCVCYMLATCVPVWDSSKSLFISLYIATWNIESISRESPLRLLTRSSSFSSGWTRNVGTYWWQKLQQGPRLRIIPCLLAMWR